MENHLLNINELSQYLNIKKATIYDMVYRKRIPYIKIGSLLRFNQQTIGRWIESRTRYPFGSEKCYNKLEVEGGEMDT